jgi:hypothetical protein
MAAAQAVMRCSAWRSWQQQWGARDARSVIVDRRARGGAQSSRSGAGGRRRRAATPPARSQPPPAPASQLLASQRRPRLQPPPAAALVVETYTPLAERSRYFTHVCTAVQLYCCPAYLRVRRSAAEICWQRISYHPKPKKRPAGCAAATYLFQGAIGPFFIHKCMLSSGF